MVIPIIFAISILLFLAQIAQYFTASEIPGQVGGRLDRAEPQPEQRLGLRDPVLRAGRVLHVLLHGLPVQARSNRRLLRKNGGFIPGIRPGKPTEDFLARVTNRITLGGALFLASLAVLPLVVSAAIPGTEALQLGGTSILIVVSVVVETMKQLEAQMLMRHYEGFIR